MLKRVVSGILVTLLLISMLTLVLSNQSVKAASEVIIDTHNDSRFTKYPSGPYWWSVSDHDVFHTRAYSNNFWYTYCGDAAHGDPYYGLWQASLPHSGQYDVFVWIPNPDAFDSYTPTQSAIYQVYYQGGMTPVTVNQRLRTGGWYSLGRYTFGTSGSIILNDRTGEPYASTMLAFDAVKFTEVAPPPCSLTVYSAHDSPNPSNGAHSYSNGQSVTCSVTSPVTEGSTTWRCIGWTGTGSVPSSGISTSVTFSITQDSTITWNWDIQTRTLTVNSAHDSPVPSVGSHTYNSGQSVTCSVTSPVTEGGVTYTCTGWSGTGSVPSSGGGTSVAFTITQDSSITWIWPTPVQRTLTVSSSHDSPNPSVGQHTYNDGSSVTCSVSSPVIEGGISYSCTGWTGTGSVPSSGGSTSVTFTITQTSSITWIWVNAPAIDVTVSSISNMQPLEGEPVIINAIVTNTGSQNSVAGSINFIQHTQFKAPVPGGWDTLIGSQSIPALGPSESRTFQFVWNAVPVKNDDPTKCLELEARAGSQYKHIYVNGINVDDRSPFKVDIHGFSFANWPWLGSYESAVTDYLNHYVPTFIAKILAKPLTPLFATGAHCYGMSSASVVYFKQGKNAFEMSKADTEYYPIGWYHMQQIPAMILVNKRIHFGMNLRDEYSKIVQNIQENQPVVMSMIFDDPQEGRIGHSVTVFNYYELSNDVKNIVTYDSEFPGTAMVFTFDLAHNSVSCPEEWTNDGTPLYVHIDAIYIGQAEPYQFETVKKILYEYLDCLKNGFKQMLSFDCPVNVTITDNFGRIISEVVNQIPGASFESCNLTGVKTFYLPVNLTYSVNIRATDFGNCTISQITPTVSNYETAFSQLTFNLTRATLAKFDLLQYSANYTLRVDKNGDGTVVNNLAPNVTIGSKEHDIGVTAVTPSKMVTGEGYTVPINSTIMNYGAHTETFQVTIYANTTLLTSQTITLANATSTTITYAWNTTGFAKGNYTMNAVIDTLPSETYTIDNALAYRGVFVSIVGDINGDKKVELKDVYAVAKAYGSVPGHPRWNPLCDINNDGEVELKDYYLTCKNYGKTWS